jgi:hypothetical protein
MMHLDYFILLLLLLLLMVLVFELRASPLARQVLHHLSHTPSSFALVCFSDRVSCLCLAVNSPTLVSWVVGIIDQYHCAWLVFEIAAH